MDRQVVDRQDGPRRATYYLCADVHTRVHFLALMMMNSLRSGELGYARAKEHERRNVRAHLLRAFGAGVGCENTTS
jgi:hypothetical protein